jgi:hypothetical protein
MIEHSIEQTFGRALESLVAQVEEDRSILAAVLCGSLAHDTVWAKSDIDLVLVTIDDRKVGEGSRSLYADGLNVHAILMSRTAFRQTVEGSTRNSFAHSLLAKGRLLYTHDASIAELFAHLAEIGERDTQVALLRAATGALAPLYKARKWLLTRNDLDYTALWILYAATHLARIEVIGRRLIADREVIPQALALSPAFFGTIYSDLLNAPKTRAGVEAALEAADGYLAERAPMLFALVIEHLREARETRSASEIEHHFKRTLDIEGVTSACEYLADQGLIGKASIPVQLTKRSTVQVQELAFYALEGRDDGSEPWPAG